MVKAQEMRQTCRNSWAYIGIIDINLLIGEKAKTLDFAVGFIWIGK